MARYAATETANVDGAENERIGSAAPITEIPIATPANHAISPPKLKVGTVLKVESTASSATDSDLSDRMWASATATHATTNTP